MTEPGDERLVRYLVVLEKPGRRLTVEEDTRWGGLVPPDPSEVPARGDGGLRVVLFGSWLFGALVLAALERYERRHPGRLCLAGLVTDDPLDPDARISVRKRVWSLLEKPYRVLEETSVIESALCHGVPVYTGEVKVPSFRRLLSEWRPDAILVCVFGQVLDAPIIERPSLGIYNFHPSDLSQHQGAGPAPYDDLAARHAGTTRWTVHHVTEEIDAGAVVGVSPLVNVLDAEGRLPSSALVVYEKLAEALGPLATLLVEELSRRHAAGSNGPIDRIDFESLFSEEAKARLVLPVRTDRPEHPLPPLALPE